jgi:phytoene dehydrogenase-like protein
LLSCGSIHLHLDKTIKETLKFNYPDTEAGIILNINKLEDFIKTEDKNLYVLNILYLPASYRIWQKIMDRYGPKTYENLKEEIAKLTISQLKNMISIDSVKSSSVFTPLSFEKWLNSSQGAIYDAACFPEQVLLNRQKFHTPIKNLYMVGAKTFPGHGVAGAMLSALSLSDILLKGRITHGRITLK